MLEFVQYLLERQYLGKCHDRLGEDIREVKKDLKNDIKVIKAHITVLTVLGVTSLLRLIGLIIYRITIIIFNREGEKDV